ncbi:MAG: N-terminal acetyltransferase A complex catalytic subunit ard1 [Watsoniomyces obsoletus]|nr:MAG: N-terminal acetyltransferase A complex catalytic subunit ard1 [Watsoniomyces obsoletus]
MEKSALDRAIESIKAGTLTERIQGLNAVKDILGQIQKGAEHVFSAKQCREIIENLEPVVRAEKTSYAKEGASQKRNASSRLALCADVLRAAIELRVRQLKKKTVEALVHLIIDTLPVTRASIAESFSVEYRKSLRTVLEYAPHTEHLLPETWLALVDFYNQVAEHIAESGVSGLESSATHSFEVVQSTGRGGAKARQRKQPASSAIRPVPIEVTKNMILDVLVPLECLVTTPHAPILDRADAIMTTMLSLVKMQQTMTTIRQPALGIFNTVFSVVAVNDTSLAGEMVKEVLPILRSWWTDKSPTLKDEVLVTFIQSLAYLEEMARKDESDTARTGVEAILSMMQTDYQRRPERELLRLEDLNLVSPRRVLHPNSPLQACGVQLRTGTSRVEQAWTVPQLIASMISILGRCPIPHKEQERSIENDGPFKRRRVETHYNALLVDIRTSELAGQLGALHVLMFALKDRILNAAELGKVMDLLAGLLSSKDDMVVSWALINLACCTFHASAADTGLLPEWNKIWHAAARASTVTAACRAACHLMDAILSFRLVAYSSVVESVNSLIASTEVNGPAALTDSALPFWTILLHVRTLENPGACFGTSERILHWLFSKWSPAKSSDRVYVTRHALHARPDLILNVILACTGHNQTVPKDRPAISMGVVAQAWRRIDESKKLLSYLLLLPEADDNSSKKALERLINMESEAQPIGRYAQLEEQVIDFCATEFEAALENWSLQVSERHQFIDADLVRTLFSLCVVGAVLNRQYQSRANRLVRLQKATEALTDALASFLSRHSCPQDQVDVVLEDISPFLPSPDHHAPKTSGLDSLLIRLGEAVRSRQELMHDPSARHSPDPMEMDLDFGTQRSRQQNGTAETSYPRSELAATASLVSFRYRTCAHLQLASLQAQKLQNSDAITSVNLSCLEYLSSLKDHEALASREFIRQWTSSDTDFNRDEANALLLHLGERLLGQYEYDSSEISFGICLDVLTGLVRIWSTDVDDELAQTSLQLCQWLINVISVKEIASPQTRMAMAELLRQLLQVQPDYGQQHSLPPVQTSLFKVFQAGDISVKFHISAHLSDIFELFVLRQHETIFDEVFSTLPKDADWKAGMAIRLLVLARLASSWYTVLRRCVYHIFEIPGLVPEMSEHASRCLGMVTTALGLSSPQDLLKLFLPQILYTWFETQPLSSIPFTIFGYQTRQQFYSDIQAEAAAQLIMRGNDDQIAVLAEALGVTDTEIILRSFDKVLAYSIARDISLPPVDDSPQQTSGEARIRKKLGKEVFFGAISRNTPQILSLLFCCLDEEQLIERAFAKHSGYDHAAGSLKRIKNYSSSNVDSPANQQPSFRAKYLLAEIEHLCHRTGRQVSQLWTPPLYTFVTRTLLDSVHPALGSLHACSVLRKIRLLVCLAGDVALQDYPLEMVLHALRPFLLDAQCAEDALGLAQFLLESGKTYLSQVPSFMAGIALSYLACSRVSLGTTHDRTTQEEDLQATRSKFLTFQTWFTAYLGTYRSADLTGASEHAFRELVRCASAAEARGSAIRGTNESGLLKALLEDEKSEHKLLSRPTRSLAFALLGKNFQKPQHLREDILGDDEASRDYAVHLWGSCQSANIGKDYLTWAGRVVGRSYAASGCVPERILRESRFQSVRDLAVGPAVDTSGSKPALLKLLLDLLFSNSPLDASLAEKTLQQIISRVRDLDDFSDCEQVLPASILATLKWQDGDLPPLNKAPPEKSSLWETLDIDSSLGDGAWTRAVCTKFSHAAKDDVILGALPSILSQVTGFAESAFPFILHILLLRNHDKDHEVRIGVSELFKKRLHASYDSDLVPTRLILTALLYLRTQPVPRESTRADRERWLELDLQEVATAAVHCGMFKTGLLMVELFLSEASRASRRSSAVRVAEPTDLLLEIFRNIDEPDSFYGVQQPAGLVSIMDRLDYEKDGLKSLSFRGAHLDGQLRLADSKFEPDTAGLIRALDHLDLNGLALSAIANQETARSAMGNAENMYRSARRLEQWDLPVPAGQKGPEATIYGVLQSLKNASDRFAFTEKLDNEIFRMMSESVRKSHSGLDLQSSWRVLATLTEMDDLLNSNHAEELHENWSRLSTRDAWMHYGRFEDVTQLMSTRENVFGILSRQTNLQQAVQTSAKELRLLEVETILESSALSRSHGALQSSLKAAMYLSELTEPCTQLGIDIDPTAQLEAANVLWDQGEMTASIGILQNIRRSLSSGNTIMHVGPAELLAKLGHQVSEARLEKPEEIISQYLVPAVKELKGVSDGDAAGRVFHEFATFCDGQLQDADNLEDFRRIERLRQRKEAEVRELDKMMHSSGSQHKSHLQSHRAKAKQWFDLDDREYQRLRQSREAFLKQSLENYLLTLKSCSKFDKDSLRFCALWLEHSDLDLANRAVTKHLASVPSLKMAPLMNQLSSRLLDVQSPFQTLLFDLLLKICTEHPYHGMYQVFSISKSRGKDESAKSRQSAAGRIASSLKRSNVVSSRWLAVHNTNVCYARLAGEKVDDKAKPGSRVALRTTEAGRKLEQDVPVNRIPPPTMTMELRADCDYSKVPVIVKFHPEMSIANGVSAPKIITAVGSNGVKYKQLVKGGNDDLRQDSIMEQVFEHVSDLLQRHRSTRQRNLAIRTYKVLPLTTNAGIIEFVPNTIPLHDYSLPAHQRYFPRDWKPKTCRTTIEDAQPKSASARVQAYRQVTEHFHPVLRYFFIERFDDPDEWFAKRLAYSRSTAAISVLGHILGLGDRHGHNILLDEETGEVVHIDLGVAFEQGRVLPVPEVVPFRLTRDIVDAMGITKTEGVFRRCCEFTLDALRREAYTIQTVLDVLRYDPLYSWTVSPLRIKKMQEPSNVPPPSAGEAAAVGASLRSKESNEPNEADRALTVVAKKLSKTLSVTATVNELIQQATDERNLAVLYCGWAAYA